MRVTTKAKSKKKSPYEELATCPVNGEGWCPYPFSMAQLKRKLKAKAAAAGEAAANTSAKTSASASTSSDKLSKHNMTDKTLKQPAAKASS